MSYTPLSMPKHFSEPPKNILISVPWLKMFDIFFITVREYFEHGFEALSKNFSTEYTKISNILVT